MYKLRKFKNISDYQAFRGGGEYKPPCVSYVTDSDIVEYGPIPQKAGDIAYWDGKKVKVCSYDLWDSSLGTPVGVVVIPKGFAPDGKTRIVSLYGVDKDGNTSTGETRYIQWAPNSEDTPVPNYNRVPLTDNQGSTTTSSDISGNLPTDYSIHSIYPRSYTDNNSNYLNTTNMIPSPYICDINGNESPNPEYYKEIEGYSNCFSDFNGLENTQILVNLGSGYTAANSCWKYNDGVSNLQWYLPAAGELGYMVPRCKVIDNTLINLNKTRLNIYNSNTMSNPYVSSSEINKSYIYTIGLVYGSVSYYQGKGNSSPYHLRCFAKLP